MALIDDVGQHIHNTGIAELGTSLFKSYLPNDPAEAMAVLDTGGLQPDRDLPVNSPTFQVYIRAATYSRGKVLLDLVRAALHGKTNQVLIPNGTFFMYIFAITEGGHLGRDESGRDLFSINFQCKVR